MNSDLARHQRPQQMGFHHFWLLFLSSIFSVLSSIIFRFELLDSQISFLPVGALSNASNFYAFLIVWDRFTIEPTSDFSLFFFDLPRKRSPDSPLNRGFSPCLFMLLHVFYLRNIRRHDDDEGKPWALYKGVFWIGCHVALEFRHVLVKIFRRRAPALVYNSVWMVAVSIQPRTVPQVCKKGS